MSDGKVITLNELRAHKSKDSFYILLHGKVYDVTKFIDEHPGGDEVILAEGGQDATEAFEDVGHSDEARALLPAMLIGEFEKDSGIQLKSGAAAAQASRVAGAVEQGSNAMYILPLAFLGAYFAWRYYSTGSV
ncbi:cytochrome b5-like heme/steroid binding domain-containing protein [Crepidotus variabilis]|uniref:Cytochrome b5-like heme/steroid binding domain-containing protein n=1 Tax=Crepidotus variabilis TaxID=179855 RepID=A0A9P6ETN9_9AGAR|nr:cytochrome b5-like heme/steroid binding domain-containing protein [Crepidotus variabilis]